MTSFRFLFNSSKVSPWDMGTGETGYVSHIEPGILTPFHYSLTFHSFLISRL